MLAVDVIGESGTVNAAAVGVDEWRTINFSQTLDDPIVIAGPLSTNGGQPANVRLRNVTDNSFQYQIEEWDYLDGAHAAENFDWVAVERGTHTLDSGRVLHAGSGSVGTSLKSFGLSGFDAKPIVFAQVASNNDAATVNVRLKDTDPAGFKMRLYEEEAADKIHADENVHYLAIGQGLGGWDVGDTGDAFNDRDFPIAFGSSVADNPVVLADMQSIDGGDTSEVRLRSRTADTATLFLEEEKSKDTETRHTNETLGYAAVPRGAITITVADAQSTFGNNGNPWAIAASGATRIQAENFDAGGQGVASNDATAGNASGANPRPDSPDVDVTNNSIGWFDNGEWLEYTVDVAAAGTYDFTARVARNGDGGNYSLTVDGGVNLTGTRTAGNTGGWGTFVNRTTRIDLAAGVQTLRLNKLGGGGVNFDWIQFQRVVESEDPNNVLPNGRFIDDVDGWQLWNNAGLDTAMSRDPSHNAPGFNGGSLRVSTAGSAGANWWDAAVVTQATLANNTDYRLTFNADAAGNRPLHVQVKRGNTAYSDVDINLNTAGTSHTVNFSTGGSATSEPTTVRFFYGNSAVNFWLDDVKLVATGTNGGGGGGGGELSADAIFVDFERHSNGTAYGNTPQNLDWNVDWTSSDMNDLARITTEQAGGGSKSLSISYPTDRQIYAQSDWNIPDRGEYYLQYKLRFEEGFDFDGPRFSGGKLPGLGTGDLCSGGQVCNGNNGFTARYMWREGGDAELYLYHMDKPGADGTSYGEQIPLFWPASGDRVRFIPGQWYTITQRVKINTGNNNNGEIEVWLNGARVLERNGLRMVNNGAQIDSMFFSTFHGGFGSDWWPDVEKKAYFDDFIVSPNRSDVGV